MLQLQRIQVDHYAHWWIDYNPKFTGRWKTEIFNGKSTVYLEVKSVFPYFTRWMNEHALRFVEKEIYITTCKSTT